MKKKIEKKSEKANKEAVKETPLPSEDVNTEIRIEDSTETVKVD